MKPSWAGAGQGGAGRAARLSERTMHRCTVQVVAAEQLPGHMVEKLGRAAGLVQATSLKGTPRVRAARVTLPETKARLAPALVQPLQGRGKRLLCQKLEEGVTAGVLQRLNNATQ